MHIAYSDEHGNTGRNLADPDQPFHQIGTVIIEEAGVMTVHDHLRDLAQRHFGARANDADFEFHGKAIFAGEGPFAAKTPAERITIYDEVLQAIGLVQAKVLVRGVDKPGLAKRYPVPFHPHDIALMFTIESLERWGRHRDCRVLIVADEAKEIEDAAIRDLAAYQRFGTTWGWKTESIDHIIDTIHFVDSTTNWAIQLADCMTFLAGRRRRISLGLSARNQAVIDLWSQRVEPWVWRNEIWYPTP